MSREDFVVEFLWDVSGDHRDIHLALFEGLRALAVAAAEQHLAPLPGRTEEIRRLAEEYDLPM